MTYVDANGGMTRWEDVLPAGLPGPSKLAPERSLSEDIERTNRQDEAAVDFDGDFGNDWIDDDVGVNGAYDEPAVAKPLWTPSYGQFCLNDICHY